MIEPLRDFLASGEEPWEPVGGMALGGASLGFGLLLLLALSSSDGWIPGLDGVNLLFHESGHPIFGLLGWEVLGILGGTLMQLLVPLLVGASFWRKRQPVGFAFALVWTGENLWNIARYMADARAQVLPLVGGGEHDWATLFGRWGCLGSDLAIAHATRIVGWLLVLGAWAWLAWRFGRGRRV